MNDIFIHIGHKEFDNELWKEVKNRNFCKPIGGLWASRINAKFGWKDWCKENNFDGCSINQSFSFRLANDARLLIIDSVEQLKELPKNDNMMEYESAGSCYLDFEKLKDKYDAIEVNISNDNRLHFALYGWDCDSILILNKNIIKMI